MSTLTSYSDLEDAIAAWIGQTNYSSARADVQANIPIWIALFEATANRRLRVRQMEATTTLTTASGSVALPSDYLDYRRLTWKGEYNQTLRLVSPDALQALFIDDTSTDDPECFTIEGGNILIRPIDDTANIYEFVYIQKISALADGSNWLFTAHPDLYLRGSLIEAAAYGVDNDQIPLWKAWRDEVFDEINMLGARSRGPGVVQVTGATP